MRRITVHTTRSQYVVYQIPILSPHSPVSASAVQVGVATLVRAQRRPVRPSTQVRGGLSDKRAGQGEHPSVGLAGLHYVYLLFTVALHAQPALKTNMHACLTRTLW